MARSKSSSRWLREHFDDHYVKRARQDGFRCRASYKLLEIQQRDGLLGPGMTVVDLGAAPGGWSQLAARLVGGAGRVVALDILPMDPLPGVEFIQGDFRGQGVYELLLDRLAGRPADLVLSDMAPNITGVKAVDQPRAIYLAELALDFARNVLRPGGDLLVKTFEGEGMEGLRSELRGSFRKVVTRKPAASRPRSREVYLLARNHIL
ncbi:MAG TPA: 23S rRNA (uridine(2552)-2'-O)-methyltransferase RlmE [Gammaproteobacteria bacterium]|nr:23S rRNA (uridine(2552)-2'-O)-methyltransferase RlmE [Gammaproteobacteria bacterium]